MNPLEKAWAVLKEYIDDAEVFYDDAWLNHDENNQYYEDNKHLTPNELRQLIPFDAWKVIENDYFDTYANCSL